MDLGLRKSQVAMEFIMLIALAFMILIVFTAVTRNQVVDIRKENEYVALKDIVHTVQSEITSATHVEDGYTRQFSIPGSLDGINYTIEISDSYILAESRHHEYLLQILPVEGNITAGVNKIRKEGGIVYLNG